MDDLRNILAGRADLYAQADLTFDTGGKTLTAAFLELRDLLRGRVLGRESRAVPA